MTYKLLNHFPLIARALTALGMTATFLALTILPAQAAVEDQAVPKAPTNIWIENRKPHKATIHWAPSEHTVKYIVEVYGRNGTQVGIFTDVTNTYKKLGERILEKSNKAYYVRIKPVNSDEIPGVFSEAKSFRTKPEKVDSLSAAAVYPESVQIQWEKPRGKIRYFLVRVINEKGKTIQLIKKTSGTTKQYPKRTINNLRPSKFYTIKVKGVYNKSNKGKYSDPLTIIPRQ
ncbi:MAG: fibronectin type III domain-containing protein [Candidatus Kerfeldbacteria bacterium]